MKRFNRLKQVLIALVFGLALVLGAQQRPSQARPLWSSPFVSGDIAVYRVGSGSGALVNTGNPVFVDEYTPAGTLIQSVPLPTTASGANKPLIASGSATSEGELTRSVDGNYLVLTGYGTTIPAAGSLSGTTAAAVPRVIGRVDVNGIVDTSTALTDVLLNGNNPRSAVSIDGSSFWLASGAGGVFYVSALGATTSTQLSTTVTNLRQANIFGGQLYVSTSSGTTVRIGTVGSGLPTTAGQTITNLPGIPTTISPYSYFFADLDNTVPGVDTLYVAENTSGNLQKYSLVGGTWLSNGGIADPNITGLTGLVNGTSVTLFFTDSSTLKKVTDSTGYNATISGTPATLATATANTTAFRGVALAPIGGPTNQPPTFNSLPGYLSGVVGDPHDPFPATLNFSVSDDLTPAGQITVTLATNSDNTAVLPNVTLNNLTGGNYSLVVPKGLSVGYAHVTLTATDLNSSTTTFSFTFGASQDTSSGTAYWLSGSSNASAAQPIDSNFMVVGDDEDQLLRVYNRAASGLPVASFPMSPNLALPDNANPEIDIEASTQVGSRLFWVGSQDNSKSGNARPNRDRIFATDLSGTGAATTLTYVGRYDHLREDLLAWDASNGHGLGANALGLTASAAIGHVSETIDGFNVEGAAMAPGSTTTSYIGFRAPLEDTVNRNKALVIPITNFAALAVSNAAAGSATFGAPIFFDLGGRSIRDIKCDNAGCLISAGGYGDPPPSFALYTWTGNPADAPQQRTTDLTGLTPEGIVELPAGGLNDTSIIQLVSDEGDTIYYNDGQAAKDLPLNLQKFRTDSVILGPVVSNATPTATATATGTATSTATATNTPVVAKVDTIGVFRPSSNNGTFFLRLHNSTGFADISVTFNPAAQAYPIVGDWTGSGVDKVGVYDQTNGLFSLCSQNDTTACAVPGNVFNFVLGNPGDIPLSGRWQASAANSGAGVFRPSNGLLYMKNNLTTGFADFTMVLGIPGDSGLAGDWTGKGFDSPGVYRPVNQHFYLSNVVTNGPVFGDIDVQYGNPGDALVVGDWIAQGHDGIGLFRQSDGFSYLKNTLVTGFADNAFTYGIAGDIPVAGHWQLAYPPAPSGVIVPATSAPILMATPTPYTIHD